MNRTTSEYNHPGYLNLEPLKNHYIRQIMQKHTRPDRNILFDDGLNASGTTNTHNFSFQGLFLSSPDDNKIFMEELLEKYLIIDADNYIKRGKLRRHSQGETYANLLLAEKKEGVLEIFEIMCGTMNSFKIKHLGLGLRHEPLIEIGIHFKYLFDYSKIASLF